MQSGTLGVVVAILAVLTYLWFRFEWQFAVGAIIGTMHDLLLTVGFFCVTQIEFNQTSIAAILTIVGYSLNETVVVLDRIREVMRKYKRLSTAEIIDMSINAVLPRTIMTATTVFLALLALFFLGGHVIRSFSAAMIWGIFVATYSSIFICSPMLIYMGVRARRVRQEGQGGRGGGRDGGGRQGVTSSSPAAPFAPGSHVIAAHGGGGFAFAGMAHQGSILATPQGVRPIDAADDRRPRRALARRRCSRNWPSDRARSSSSSSARESDSALAPKPLRAALREAGLRFEVMATGPALRVYNIMQSERPPGRGGPDRDAVTASEPISAGTLAEAFRHCAALARENARDQWLGALYAPAGSRDALLRAGHLRPRNPPGATAGPRPQSGGAAARVVAGGGARRRAMRRRGAVRRRLRCAPRSRRSLCRAEAIEAMLDARLTEIAPPQDFPLAAFEEYAAESEGARLRLASRIAAGGRDLDETEAQRGRRLGAWALAPARRPLFRGGAPGEGSFRPTSPAGMARPARTSTPGRASPGVVAATR